MIKTLLKDSPFRHFFFGGLTLLFLFALIGILFPVFANTKYDGRAKGTVISSEAVRHGAGRFEEFRPVINYQYTVAEETFNNDKYCAGSPDGSKSWAKAIVSNYPPGSECVVYYSIDSPFDSVIDLSLSESAERSSWVMFSALAIVLAAWYAFGFHTADGEKLPGVEDEKPNLQKQ